MSLPKSEKSLLVRPGPILSQLYFATSRLVRRTISHTILVHSEIKFAELIQLPPSAASHKTPYDVGIQSRPKTFQHKASPSGLGGT